MPTSLLHVDAYEEMAAAFQCSLIQVLDAVLKRHDLSLQARRAICRDFVGMSGVVLDQYWIESEAGRVFPVLGFAKKHPDYEPEELYLNNGAFSFSEYAGGNIQWYFDEHGGEPEPQAMGPVGDQGEPG